MRRHASLMTPVLLPRREPPGTQPEQHTVSDTLAAQQLMQLYLRSLQPRRTTRIPRLRPRESGRSRNYQELNDRPTTDAELDVTISRIICSVASSIGKLAGFLLEPPPSMRVEETSKHRSGFRRLIAGSFWAVLMTAFVAVSTPKILRGAAKNSIHLIGPFHSTDSFLYFDTGEINGSERIIKLFESIPSSQQVVIFVRNDDRRSGFVGMLTAYLAWPHPVRIVDVAHAGWAKESADTDFESVGGFVFCRVARPGWWPRGEQCGETLEVLPAASIAQR